MEQEEMSVKLEEVNQRSKSNTHRLDEVEKRLSDNEKLVTSVAIMAQKQDAMEKDIGEIKTDVKTLAEKPARRWDDFTRTIITAVASGGVGYLLAATGLK